MWITRHCGKFLQRWECQTTLPASWETCMHVRKQQLEPDMEQWIDSTLGKEYDKVVFYHPAYFNLYAEYIMWNAGLGESQVGIKIAGRNIKNLRYANDTTIVGESEELKSLLMKVKEVSEKAGLKLNIQKLRSWQSVPSLYTNRLGNNTNSDRLYFLGLQNHCGWWLQLWN